MTIPKFDPNELKIVAENPDFFGDPEPIPVYNTPATGKEAVKALFERKAMWQILNSFGTELKTFAPRINPENIARAMVLDALAGPGGDNPQGGKDLFGIDWEFIPSANGSMVRPGKPFIADANELMDKVVWPDIDSWDWEGCKITNKDYLSGPYGYYIILFTGFFERLISFMDFEGAIIALADDEQQDAIKEFFDKLSDFYIRLIDKYITFFPEIDFFTLHDDWGAQKDTFFSPALAKEMIVPYMKKIVDFVHAKGKYIEIHSCGYNMKQIENYIAAGFDMWCPQHMNDTVKLYECYGDKILIGVMPPDFDPKTTSEDEQRAIAKAYCERFCRPDKPSMLNYSAYLNFTGINLMTRAFREEIYKQSRINYSK
ncbi:methyltransferase [Dehalobacter sp. DCM]|uniref:uroporphyrinogen decarboxylase family protein n=1 Tax=Dehalobacter sp. DCM TaxID=2907827 RepID=UPI003081E771|nr:methyltransferase [Dehalobacter sp. DCM]